MKNFKTVFLLMVSFLFFSLTTNAQLDKQQTQLLAEKILNQHFKSDEPGATLLVAQNGNILFKGAKGMANLEHNIPMQADHILRIGSLTKQFTAVAILMLQEEGKLNVNDDITKHLPTYPTLDKKITIEHLLTHTSGIRSYTSLPDFMSDIRGDRTPQEMIDIFKNKKMIFEPGEEFSYNNSGYFLLGAIIEKVSGMTYSDFIEKKVFEKVGMKNSYYGTATSIIPNRASGYEMRNGKIINAPYLSMTIPYAAGSLLSTVEDLYKWNQAVHAYQLVTKSFLEKAFTPFVLNNGKATRYGYGWGIGNFYKNKSYQHSGGINGFVTYAMYLPNEDIFIAAFSNGKDPEFMTDLLAAQLLEEYPDVERKNISAEQLSAYKGVYQVENSRQKRTIQVKDNHLTSIRSGGSLKNLYPLGEHKFFFENSLEIFEFKVDKKDKVLGIIAYLPNGKIGRAIKTGEVEEKKEVQLDNKTLEEYVGKYELESGAFLTFIIEKNHLWIIDPNEEKLQIFAEGNDKFFLKDVDAHLEFIKENDKIVKVMVNLGGQLIEAKRL